MRRSLRAALLLLGVAGLACQPDLGECASGESPGDDREVVFLVNGSPEDGTPLYAGQALQQQHCGNSGFCHSQAATGNGRRGAPAGLDFDVFPACIDDASCEGAIEAQVERLRESQHETYEHRFDIWRTVDDGSMPPGAAGESVRATDVYYRDFDPDTGEFTNPLPGLDTPEGRRIYRNWLACGAPVVEQAREPAAGERPGASCSDVMGTVGDCRVRAGSIEPPDPSWTSIFERIVEPLCVECHRDDGNPFFGPSDQQLDLCRSTPADSGPCDPAAVHAALVGQTADGCGGTLIVAGDPDASVFLDKMGPSPACGDPMPLGDDDGLPAAILAPIRQWIQDGASL